MRPKLDQFFNDHKYGRLKLYGYQDRGYLFSVYEKMSAAHIVESKGTLWLSQEEFINRFKAGILTRGFPPA